MGALLLHNEAAEGMPPVEWLSGKSLATVQASGSILMVPLIG